MAGEFSMVNGLLRGRRIVVPPALCKELLTRIHDGNQGITKCRERARNSVWWLGISHDLEELVRKCDVCVKEQTQRAQPLVPSALPQLPWQLVASDLFQWKDTMYVLLVDYYSRYIEMARLDRVIARK